VGLGVRPLRKIALQVADRIQEVYGVAPELSKVYAVLEVFTRDNPDVDPETIDWASHWNPYLPLEEVVEKLREKYPRYIWPNIIGDYIRIRNEPEPWLEILERESMEKGALGECPLCRLAPPRIQSRELDKEELEGFRRALKKWYLYGWDDIIEACKTREGSSRGVRKALFTLMRLYVKSLRMFWMVLCLILFILLSHILYSRE
jgi:hypothetical protein